MSKGDGMYGAYDADQDVSQIDWISLWEEVPANSSFTITLPFKIIGDTSKAVTTTIAVGDVKMDLQFATLHPAQIETPAKPTTDKATATTGILQ
ncbi:hypothetical protein GTO87_08910 [Ligilactobacillus saerimneri]|uniref:Uncharacterized protein n=1 Tax=Ligilactobacillus saerimneri TaxID=228229 RepID=A0A7H9ELT5_9LACO|nr:hypothetical protein [Ligilactobacillus saerimneri]QLL78693.1 hypothetical protein GTO87_08910 [Ligilactobacillus saerimneri]